MLTNRYEGKWYRAELLHVKRSKLHCQTMWSECERRDRYASIHFICSVWSLRNHYLPLLASLSTSVGVRIAKIYGLQRNIVARCNGNELSGL